MVPRQLPLIRAVAQAALQQNKLTPYAYDDVVHWIDRLERESQPLSDDQAIRRASEMMINRLCRSATAFVQAPDAELMKLEAL